MTTLAKTYDPVSVNLGDRSYDIVIGMTQL